MKFILALILVFSQIANAQVSREEAEKILDEMVKSNQVSAEEAMKTKVRIRLMHAENEHSGRTPASISVSDPGAVDLGEEQMDAIQSDLQIIAPHVSQVHVERPYGF